jgi:1-acyl-sn-glycerol-3-phosphate acyltransferase
MKKIFGFLLLIWVGCWAVLATIVVFIPMTAAAFFVATGNLAFNISNVWARVMLLASLVRVRIINRDRIAKGRSYVVVANHQSFYDILAIVTTLGIQFRWVIKKEILKVPLFGYALYASRNIFIDRGDRRQAMESIHRGMERLPTGTSVMIFPEGGRSMDGLLRPFKKGAFVMAIEKKWPVLPVTINGSRGIHAKKTRHVLPGTMEVIVGEPIDTAPYDEKRLGDLMERARADIASHHLAS